MPTLFRFRHLRESTTKVQGQMVEGIAPKATRATDVAKYQEALAAQKTKKETTARDVVNYLLYVGLDYKGQIQMASEAHGLGGGAEVSVNPFGLVGLNTEIGVATSIKGAKQRTVVVSRGPSEVTLAGKVERVPNPIVVNSIIGKYWESKSQLSLDVSVGAEASAGVSPTSSGTAPTSKSEHGYKSGTGTKDPEPPAYGYEAVGVTASFKTGFKAEAGYTYDHFYGEDVFPLSFADQEAAKKKLEVILREGSTKTTLKLDACEFINANVLYFGNKRIDLHGSILWHTTTAGHKEIITQLNAVSPTAPQSVKTEAREFIHKLDLYDHAGDKSCFLRLSSHKPEGKAGLYAAGEAKGSAGLASVGVNADAFLGVSGEYKKAFARFQTMVTTESQSVVHQGVNLGTVGVTPVYTTYDAVVTYSSFALGLALGFDANFNVLSYGKSLSKDTRLGEATDKLRDKTSWKPDRLNQIRYVCAIATWARPLAGFARGLRPGQERDGGVKSVSGTGFAVGQSFCVGNLVKFYEGYYDVPTSRWKAGALAAPYTKLIALALGIKEGERQKVLDFLDDPYVASTIAGFLPLDVGVFIEATYRVGQLPDLKVKIGVDKETTREQIQLHKEFGRGFQGSPHVLESIRLRYRKRDVFEKDGALFTVGFKIAGTGAKIKLDRVDRAGADGIVDVATVFVDQPLKTLAASGGNQSRAYERAVPPAALFCQ